MNIESYLKRTNKTNLLDEELLILDILFNSNDAFESLVKENYASWHNLRYSHNLDGGTLREMIEKLIDHGIIRSHTSGPGNQEFYALTEGGGKWWEAERAPDWQRYCTDSSTVDENGTWTLLVESPSILTAKAFMVCAIDCCLYRFNREETSTTILIGANISTVAWKSFQTVCSISVTTDPILETHQLDWNEYENKRLWWRNLSELEKFQRL
jgi:predicted transcriptional regulator